MKYYKGKKKTEKQSQHKYTAQQKDRLTRNQMEGSAYLWLGLLQCNGNQLLNGTLYYFGILLLLRQATFYNDRVLYLAYFDSGYVFDRIQLECSYYCGSTQQRRRKRIQTFLFSSILKRLDYTDWLVIIMCHRSEKRHSRIRKLVCFDGSLHNLETVKNERLTDPSWRSSGDQSGLEKKSLSSFQSLSTVPSGTNNGFEDNSTSHASFLVQNPLEIGVEQLQQWRRGEMKST